MKDKPFSVRKTRNNKNGTEGEVKYGCRFHCPSLTHTLSSVRPLLYQTGLILLQNKAPVDTFLPQIMPLYISSQRKACVDIIYRGCHVHYLYYYVIFYGPSHLNDIVNFVPSCVPLHSFLFFVSFYSVLSNKKKK